MIIQADARNIPLGDGCVQTVVTSPPYWGLRDYGVSGQIGLEPTPEDYVATMVAVFREVRRVCRDDATCWLNLGDSFAGSGHGLSMGTEGPKQQTNGGSIGVKAADVPRGLKPKDLIGIPWRVAFALQADGWWLRSAITLCKQNPMPESVEDRPVSATEMMFLLSKRDHYFYDHEAVRERASAASLARIAQPNFANQTGGPKDYGRGLMGNPGPNSRIHNSFDPAHPGEADGKPRNPSRSMRQTLENFAENPGRNLRNWWVVTSEPNPEAHFASFGQKWIEPCILAGTSEKGCCAQCGAPRVRIVERVEGEPESYHGSTFTKGKTGINGNGRVGESPRGSSQTTGWRPSCSHDAPSVPCLVLDPFLGSGTTGKVAEKFGRRWVGLELSGAYIQIAERRTAQAGLGL